MKKHFNFSRGQKVGVVSIGCVIIVLTILLNVNYHLGPGEYKPVDLSDITFNKIENSAVSGEDNVKEITNSEAEHNDVRLVNFNPNELNVAGWVDIGFSEKQAKSIVNYKENYGDFKKPEDIQKLYVVSEEKFLEIEPYLIFDNQSNADVDTQSENDLIEINTASKESLESINGIGPVFSDRIIKYRSLLGGFHNNDQFSEIYGLKDESLNALINNVSIDKSKLSRININQASKTDLKKHPYLNKWEIISAILSERDKEEIQNLEFLLESQAASQEEINKIEPYISY